MHFLIFSTGTHSLVEREKIVSLHLDSIEALPKLIEKETNIASSLQRLWICQNQYAFL